MHILVTGGAGYIGSHAVKMLRALSHDVVVLDNLSTGFKQSVPMTVPFYEVATHATSAVKEILVKHHIEAVMHFAAFSLVGESVENPLKYYQNNVEGTRALIEAMLEAGVHQLIFSSTAAVYGSKDQQPITETMTENPENPYGETKLAIERMLQWTAIKSPLNYVTLRYFNVAGSASDGTIGENHNPETHLIPNVIKSVLSGKASLSVFGDDYSTKDGTAIRDYIHVEDLIEAHIAALHYLQAGGKSETINLGSSSGYSVLDVITTTEKILKQPVPYTVSARRAGDPAMLIASHDKAKQLLNWSPKRTLEQMIQSASDYYKNQIKE